MDRYETVKRLGLGAHGVVQLVRHNSSKKLFALKKIEIDERKKSRTKEAVLKEASILAQLKHPHIVLFHECFVDPTQEYVCLILDFCDGGNLSERIQDARETCTEFSEKQAMQWFIQIVMAVQYIHSKHVLHRDLKAENVLLNKRNVVKIGDFGISKILDNTLDVAKTVVGTPSYLSPELCQDISYNSKSDIWAVGCLLYEMCALQPPFEGNSLIGLFFNIVKAEYKPMSPCTPMGIQNLIGQILVKTPEDRPSASAILNVPYVKGHLASFIADTESIRAVRGRREIPDAVAGGDCGKAPLLLGVPPPSKAPLMSQSPQQLRRSKYLHPVKASSEVSSLQKAPKASGDNLPYSGSAKGKDVSEPGANKEDDEAQYSDDFDESSGSEVEEDLPEEEDLPQGKSDDEVHYADDFEDCDSDEDLVEVVNQAKEAQELEAVDDFFAEEDEDLTLSQTLTQAQVFRSRMKNLEDSRYKSQLPESSTC